MAGGVARGGGGNPAPQHNKYNYHSSNKLHLKNNLINSDSRLHNCTTSVSSSKTPLEGNKISSKFVIRKLHFEQRLEEPARSHLGSQDVRKCVANDPTCERVLFKDPSCKRGLFKDPKCKRVLFKDPDCMRGLIKDPTSLPKRESIPSTDQTTCSCNLLRPCTSTSNITVPGRVTYQLVHVPLKVVNYSQAGARHLFCTRERLCTATSAAALPHQCPPISSSVHRCIRMASTAPSFTDPNR